ncbi:helix-hairpin-helix domain-containing protein [Patescibacteria group bacterium]
MDSLKLPLAVEEKSNKFSFSDFISQNKFSFIFALLGIFLIGLGIVSVLILSSKENDTLIEILPVEEEEGKEAEIYVHMAGAVQKPGLYKLPTDSRVNDALIAAQGLSVEADRVWFETSVNLAQKLTDGVKMYIPFQGEATAQVAGEQTSIFISSDKSKVNINTASLSKLQSLTNIGPATAQKIVDYREKNGSFSSTEDIIKVAGIGEKTYETIKENITIF